MSSYSHSDMHKNGHGSFSHNSPKLETTHQSENRETKSGVNHVVDHYTAMKMVGLFTTIWMTLTDTMLSKRSQL